MSYPQLTEYCVVVDPASQGLEVQIRRGEADAAPRWTWLHRLTQLTAVEAPFTINQHAPNLFGTAATLADSDLVLGYDAQGVLTEIWYRVAEGWDRREIIEELNGQVPRLPSTRIVFPSVEVQDEFNAILMRLAEAYQQADPLPMAEVLEMLHIIAQPDCHLRMITVAALPSEQRHHG